MTTPDTRSHNHASASVEGADSPQGVARLLQLLRNSRDLGDFTPERVSKAFDVEVRAAGDTFGYGFEVTSDWIQNFDYSAKYKRFRFGFDPVHAGKNPEMNGVCYQLDRLASELEAMGFSKEEKRGEHGRLMNYSFQRVRDGIPEMRIEVMPHGEREAADGKGIGRTCVRTVYIY